MQVIWWFVLQTRQKCIVQGKVSCTVKKMDNSPTQPPSKFYKYSPSLPHIHLSKVSLHLFHNIQLSPFLLFLIESRFVLTLIYLSIYPYMYMLVAFIVCRTWVSRWRLSKFFHISPLGLPYLITRTWFSKGEMNSDLWIWFSLSLSWVLAFWSVFCRQSFICFLSNIQI